MTPLPMLVMQLTFGSALHGVPPDDDDLAEVSARYEKCAGASTPECKRLQWRLEAALYGKLRAIVGSTGERLPPDVLRAALEAETPQLKAFALQRMPSPVPGDLLPLVLAALDSQYAMVREPALSLLGNTDAKYRKFSDRATRTGDRKFPVANPVQPDAADLGGPVYAGARYRPFASSEEFALFTTADAQDRVIAFYAKANRPAQSAAEVKAGMQRKAMAMQDPMQMMELMKKAQAEGKNPAEVMMAKQKEMMGGGNILAFEGKAGVSNPRYIALDDAGTRRVLVFRDDSLGATSIVFFVTSPQAAAVMAGMGRSSGADPTQAMELQQWVNTPLLESEN